VCKDISGSEVSSSEDEYSILELTKIRVESVSSSIPAGEMNVLCNGSVGSIQ
jgi:hypothetical protein